MKKSTCIITLVVLFLLSLIGCNPITEIETQNNGYIPEYPEIRNLSVINLSCNYVVQWDANEALSKYEVSIRAENCDSGSGNEEASYDCIVPAGYDQKKKIYYDTGFFAVRNLKENVNYCFSVGIIDTDGNLLSEVKFEKTISATNYDSNDKIVQTINYTDAAKQYSFDVKKETKYLVLNGVEGKNISFANVNISDSVIEEQNVSYAQKIIFPVDARNMNIPPLYKFLKEDDVLLKSFIRNIDNYVAPFSRESSKIAEQLPELKIPGTKDFVPPLITDSVKIVRNEGAARNASSSDEDKFDLNNLTLDGTTYRYLWLDNEEKFSTFKHSKVTLRAIGKNDNEIKCFVWVDEDCFTSGKANGKKVNSKVAEHIASVFASHCDGEREIYGQEADFLFEDIENIIDMDESSKTKKIVNIVIYDIGNDFSRTGGSVVGYFWEKDYYAKSSENYSQNSGYSKVLDMSNAGKYFYIDAPFCNYSGLNEDDKKIKYCFDGVTEGTEASGEVLSTLFHEFQHMIHYGMKGITEYKTSTWYNEMCSMLAEDMFQELLGIELSDSPYGRLPTFNLNYYYSGITDWRSDGFVGVSYAGSYAFGAFLVRNFGGVPLVEAMLRNKKADMESVIDAIKEVSGLELSQESLIKAYLEACAFRTDFAVKNNISNTFFKEGQGYVFADGKEVKFKKINLYSDSASPHQYYSQYAFGPRRFSPDKAKSLRPKSFVINGVGNLDKSETSCIIVLTSEKEHKDELVVMIQDAFDLNKPSTLK